MKNVRSKEKSTVAQNWRKLCPQLLIIVLVQVQDIKLLSKEVKRLYQFERNQFP